MLLLFSNKMTLRKGKPSHSSLNNLSVYLSKQFQYFYNFKVFNNYEIHLKTILVFISY